jgi:DNA repair protein RecO (recombination protein O)
VNRTTDIIVLHTTKYGENAAVLHTLSREYGRRSFLVKGVGKKSMTTLFLPLSILEADIIESTRSNLFSARNLTARYPLLGIRNSHYKNPMTMFMSEVLFRVVREGCNEDGLYEWCEKSILLLDAMESDFSNFHLRFLLELAVALGFRPDASDLMPFVGEHYPVIERLMTSSFGESMLIPLSGVVRNELAERILRYIEFHSETSVNVRSLNVLRELFNG